MPKSGLIINTFELDKPSSWILFVAIERSGVVSFCADVGTAVSVLIGAKKRAEIEVGKWQCVWDLWRWFAICIMCPCSLGYPRLDMQRNSCKFSQPLVKSRAHPHPFGIWWSRGSSYWKCSGQYLSKLNCNTCITLLGIQRVNCVKRMRKSVSLRAFTLGALQFFYGQNNSRLRVTWHLLTFFILQFSLWLHFWLGFTDRNDPHNIGELVTVLITCLACAKLCDTRQLLGCQEVEWTYGDISHNDDRSGIGVCCKWCKFFYNTGNNLLDDSKYHCIQKLALDSHTLYAMRRASK